MSLLQSFIERWMPPFVSQSNIEQYRRAKLITGVALVVIVIDFILTPIELLQGRLLMSFMNALFTLSGVLTIVIARSRTERALDMAAWLLCWAAFGYFVFFTALNGGVTRMGCSALIIPPIFAVLMIHRQASILFAVLSLAAVISMVVAAMQFEVVFPWRGGIGDVMSAVVPCLLGVSTLMQLLDNARSQSQELLEAARQAMQHRVEEVEILKEEQTKAREKESELLHATQEIHQRLNHGITTMLTEMERFASGDLTVRIALEASSNGSGQDTDTNIARLYAGFNEAVAALRPLMKQVHSIIEQTATTAEQLSDQAGQVADGMSRQSNQTTSVAAAMEEISSMIESNSDQAIEASKEARLTEQEAKQSGTSMTETLDAVERIAEMMSRSVSSIRALHQSSEQIGEITQVIEEIADQTNLLALNAAIEAARAGDQGRGFAVVADEVRKLAERTQKATKEIASTIKNIQHQTGDAVKELTHGAKDVERGKTSAERTTKSLDRIIQQAQRVAGIIENVAADGQQQATTITEITRNVEDIQRVANDTSTAMRGSMEHIRQLELGMRELEQAVEQFRIEESATSQHTLSAHTMGMLPQKAATTSRFR